MKTTSPMSRKRVNVEGVIEDKEEAEEEEDDDEVDGAEVDDVEVDEDEVEDGVTCGA